MYVWVINPKVGWIIISDISIHAQMHIKRSVRVVIIKIKSSISYMRCGKKTLPRDLK